MMAKKEPEMTAWPDTENNSTGPVDNKIVIADKHDKAVVVLEKDEAIKLAEAILIYFHKPFCNRVTKE